MSLQRMFSCAGLTFILTIKHNVGMKKETWKIIIQTLVTILTAIGTTLGISSCM